MPTGFSPAPSSELIASYTTGKPWTVSDEVHDTRMVIDERRSTSSAALDKDAPVVTPYAG